MNEVIENIRQRRSIRKFDSKKIPRKVIKEIVEAGRYAPSSHNSQPWRFVVIENREKIRMLSDYIKSWFRKRIGIGRIFGIFNSGIRKEVESGKKRLVEADLFFYDAPALIAVCSEDGKFADKDCACAAQNMMLAARSMGIGSCWIGFADVVINTDKKLMRSLGVPDGYKIRAHLVFGYPVRFPDKPYPRKDEAHIIDWYP